MNPGSFNSSRNSVSVRSLPPPITKTSRSSRFVIENSFLFESMDSIISNLLDLGEFQKKKEKGQKIVLIFHPIVNSLIKTRQNDG